MSFDMFPNIENMNVTIVDMVESDHVPVELCIYIDDDNNFQPRSRGAHTNKRMHVDKLRWQKDKEVQYKENLCRNENINKLNLATATIDVNVDEAIVLFNDCVKSAAECMIQTCNEVYNTKDKKWYDRECEEAKIECRKKLNIFRDSRKDDDRQTYVLKRKVYQKNNKAEET